MMDANALSRQEKSFTTTTSGGSNSGEITISITTPLTPENIKELFTSALRHDVPLYIQQLGFNNEQFFYAEALKFAQITYDNVVSSLSQGQAQRIVFPPSEKLEDTASVEDFFQAILKNEAIVSQDINDHLETHTTTLSSDQLKIYEADQHQRARMKLAGSWAEPARAVVALKEAYRIATNPTHTEAIRARSAQKEGRDLAGRIAYYLMNVPVSTIAEGLVGFEEQEGAGKQRGMAQFGLNIINAFSDAACHNDARQMCDLLSESLFYKETKAITKPEDVGDLYATMLLQIKTCPGVRQVLKISNFANHSVVYLLNKQIGKCTKYESIASPDSTTILYNDLIRLDASETDLEGGLKADLSGLSQGGVNPSLEWEIHEATSLETLRTRLYKRLRAATTDISSSLTLAASNKLKEVNVRGDEHTHGLTFDVYKHLYLPLETINSGGEGEIILCNYTDKERSVPGALIQGATYRLGAQKQWMRVVFVAPVNDLPSWMSPCEHFLVQDVHTTYQKPQLRDLDAKAGELQSTIMQFVMQVAKNPKLLASLTKPANANYDKDFGDFEIVEDPFWETGVANRLIIYRKKK
jgi:hypothetical protein